MNISGSSAYAMTSRRRPWRQPGFLSQLPTGISIRNASASSSPCEVGGTAGAGGGGGGGGGGGRGRGGGGGGGRGGRRGRGGGGGGALGGCWAAAGAGSRRRMGPCADPSVSSTGWVTATRVTDCPPWKVGAWPTFSKTHPSRAQVSWACLRETDGSPTTTSLSVA